MFFLYFSGNRGTGKWFVFRILAIGRLIENPEKSLLCAYLPPGVVGNTTNEQIAALFETYETDLSCNFDKFNREVARWRTRWIYISRVLPQRDRSVYYVC